MSYSVQEKSIDFAFGWFTVAEHDSKEAAEKDAVSRALDRERNGGRDAAPREYRVLDSGGGLVSICPPFPDVEARWRREHP